MNAKTILFAIAIIASANTFAAGRDSVYAQPGTAVRMSTKAIVSVQGRSSVYAKDLPVVMKSTRQATMSSGKFGRA